ncbi:MAG TPA: hypothetical protein VG652_07890 [Gaiellaceae bacterium]|nr:hypothetical protein [Gaiellaceae bacterium]
MTRFKPGDRVRVLRREDEPIGAVVIGHDDSERDPSGRVVLRIIVEFDDGSRSLLVEDSPWITHDLFGDFEPEPVAFEPDERVAWRKGTDPAEITELLSDYLSDKPDLSQELAASIERKLTELQDNPTPEQTLEILSQSADELLARLRQDSPQTREVRAGDLVLDELPTPSTSRGPELTWESL